MNFKVKFLSILICLSIIFMQTNIIFASKECINNIPDINQSSSNNDIVVWDKPPSHWYQRAYRYFINSLIKIPIYLTAQILVTKAFAYIIDTATHKTQNNSIENTSTNNREFSFMWGKLNFSISLKST